MPASWKRSRASLSKYSTWGGGTTSVGTGVSVAAGNGVSEGTVVAVAPGGGVSVGPAGARVTVAMGTGGWLVGSAPFRV